MSTEKSDALVIRIADFSESSRVVSFFTRDFGRISTVAKGGRRLKGPFEAALDLLAACRIVFIRKSSGGLDILTEAKLLSRFKPGDRDLDRFYGGYYVAELLGGLTAEFDPHPELFDASLRTLSRLQDSDPKLALVRFELSVLREIGQLPSWDRCVACGRGHVSEGAWRFSVVQGGLVCPRCSQETSTGESISAGTVAVLRRLSEESDAVVDRLTLSQRQLQEARRVLRGAVSQALGHPPRTLRYLSN
jgi:DNA repair protein RecO (recombination protein O)